MKTVSWQVYLFLCFECIVVSSIIKIVYVSMLHDDIYSKRTPELFLNFKVNSFFCSLWNSLAL